MGRLQRIRHAVAIIGEFTNLTSSTQQVEIEFTTIYRRHEKDVYSPWIAAAVDRVRFRQRIETNDILLHSVLTKHYGRYLDFECDVLGRLLKGCVIEQLKIN
jgi:hypothetical protein